MLVTRDRDLQLELVTLNIIFGIVGIYPTKVPLQLSMFIRIPTRIWWASGLHGNSRCKPQIKAGGGGKFLKFTKRPSLDKNLVKNHAHAAVRNIWDEAKFQML